MPFERFVQTGRIAKASAGPLKGRLVAIVDVIDQNRVLVDGPLTGVPRQEYRLNNLHLTKYRIKFPFTAPTRIVRKAWTESDLKAQWKVSPWSVKAQNICKRSQLNDFDRFKLRYAKRQRNKLLTIAFNTLKKRTKFDGTPRILKKDRRERLRAEKAKGGKKAAPKK
ncbi:60S ribosomal protein L14 [Drosophila madeirensis]|uniref:Large ribosomal subunit protein eL14 n=18 Tax=Sophophora TaxID=32341 RepID=A0A3B0JXF1_DROGU|nr:60S ribosomal protein L14 [Drosophila subobscura]SPP77401.1 blast:60S ribosomal protein L14 [Drosophila guanche]